jgi:hypothetical protein
MYCLIIESGFLSMSDSFNNRVADELGFVEPSLGNLTGSFVRLQPYFWLFTILVRSVNCLPFHKFERSPVVLFPHPNGEWQTSDMHSFGFIQKIGRFNRKAKIKVHPSNLLFIPIATSYIIRQPKKKTRYLTQSIHLKASKEHKLGTSSSGQRTMGALTCQGAHKEPACSCNFFPHSLLVLLHFHTYHCPRVSHHLYHTLCLCHNHSEGNDLSLHTYRFESDPHQQGICMVYK